MNLLFGLLVLLLVAGSLVADYKWKQWIKSREQARQRDRDK
jgi:hypothetical protein